MKSFYINGCICANDSQKESFEDLTPTQIISWLNKLEDNESAEIFISSLGGDVFSGFQIYNAMRQASKKGHKIITHCNSIAASIASIIFFGGDELVIDSNAFLMIHLPWSMGICGNAIEIRKEADTLDQIRDQMIAIYQKHMDVTKEELIDMLENETWLSANELKNYGVNVSINDVDSNQYRIAASMAKRFKNIPKGLIKMENEEQEKEVEKTVEETVDENETVKEPEQEEQAEKTVEELETELQKLIEENESLKEELAKCKSETVEDRVSGMQSKMQSKINALVKEHSEKISNFENEINIKNQKLADYENEVISLKSDIEKSARELKIALSALEEKTTALDNLNSRVLNDSKPTSVDWKSLKGDDFFDYLRNHPELVK